MNEKPELNAVTCGFTWRELEIDHRWPRDGHFVLNGRASNPCRERQQIVMAETPVRGSQRLTTGLES